MAPTVKICLQCRRLGFNPWVRKIFWGKEWLPTPILLPKKTPMDRGTWWATVHGAAKSDTTEWLTLFKRFSCSLAVSSWSDISITDIFSHPVVFSQNSWSFKGPRAHIHLCYSDLLRNGRSHSFPGTPGTEGGGESAVSGRSAWETLASNDVGGRLYEVQITGPAALGGVKAPPAVNWVTLGRYLHLSYWSFQHHSHLFASLECSGLGPSPDENLHF